MQTTSMTYREAGVDIDAGDDLVERIKPFAKATRIAEVLSDVGGFAGMCRVPDGVDEPVLVSGTDGVGTKLKVAFMTGIHSTIGIDLVAMCVNDIITSGARPLFFLDYFATSKLNVAVAESVIRGIADGCKEVGCALLGGETAELPGMYAPGEYDLAGFAVGVVAKRRIVDGRRVDAGDVVIGLPSSGLHSNGYSLARRVLFDTRRWAVADRPVELGGVTVGEALLKPTRLYAKAASALTSDERIDVRAMSHITGGGIPGNLPRVLPEGLGVALTSDWSRPAILEAIRAMNVVSESELRRTFNDGIGFAIIVKRGDEARAIERLREVGEQPIVIGSVVSMPVETPFEERVSYGNVTAHPGANRAQNERDPGATAQ